jgi:hypothetical protein
MLEFASSRRFRTCEGTTRRDFLRAGSLGLGGLTLGGLMQRRAAAAAGVANDTSIIWLWLGGGPSQFETFDPKMDAPVEFRSVTGELQTSLPGVTFGGTFPKLAARAHRIAVLRNFAHAYSGHGGGTHVMNTGVPFIGFDADKPQIAPSFGSAVAYRRGLSNPASGMPTYVKLGGNIRADRPAYFGKAFAPFDPTGSLENMVLGTPRDRFDDRRALLTNLDSLRREFDATGLMEAMSRHDRQAMQLLTGSVADAFDLSKEDPKVVARYGSEVSPSKQTKLGESLLIARRLCEAGCGVVNVGYGGWDHHNVNGTLPVKEGFESLGPPLDHALATFIDDIHDRGLDKKILLVACGEFGRTPRISAGRLAGGRDHWGPLTALLMIGGGLKMGQVVGRSNPKGEEPDGERYSPQDMLATIFHVLGIPPRFDLSIASKQGDRPVVESAYEITGRPIRELI